MSQSVCIILIAIGGGVSIGTIGYIFVKIMINTVKYANEKNKHN